MQFTCCLVDHNSKIDLFTVAMDNRNVTYMCFLFLMTFSTKFFQDLTTGETLKFFSTSVLFKVSFQ
jgi:F0F1-type ATP synthase assembly protein I